MSLLLGEWLKDIAAGLVITKWTLFKEFMNG
jgi:hypothetical protein